MHFLEDLLDRYKASYAGDPLLTIIAPCMYGLSDFKASLLPVGPFISVCKQLRRWEPGP